MQTNRKHVDLLKIVAIPLIGLMVFSALPPQSQAAEQAKPGPEHKKLEMWVGEWTYELTGEVTPWHETAIKLRGVSSARSVLGGFFVKGQDQGIGDDGRLWQMIWFIGYDEKEKSYVFRSFENDGYMQSRNLEVDGNTWTLVNPPTDSNGKTYQFRQSNTFSSDGRSITEIGEYSADDGKTWTIAHKATYTKASP